MSSGKKGLLYSIRVQRQTIEWGIFPSETLSNTSPTFPPGVVARSVSVSTNDRNVWCQCRTLRAVGPSGSDKLFERLSPTCTDRNTEDANRFLWRNRLIPKPKWRRFITLRNVTATLRKTHSTVFPLVYGRRWRAINGCRTISVHNRTKTWNTLYIYMYVFVLF